MGKLAGRPLSPQCPSQVALTVAARRVFHLECLKTAVMMLTLGSRPGRRGTVLSPNRSGRGSCTLRPTALTGVTLTGWDAASWPQSPVRPPPPAGQLPMSRIAEQRGLPEHGPERRARLVLEEALAPLWECQGVRCPRPADWMDLLSSGVTVPMPRTLGCVRGSGEGASHCPLHLFSTSS